MSTTKPWTEQDMRINTVESVVRMLRESAAEGHLDRRDWDHNNPLYVSPRSNKSLKQAAAIVTGDSEIDYDAAWRVMCRIAFGG